MTASFVGYTDIVEMLIQANAQVDMQNKVRMVILPQENIL